MQSFKGWDAFCHPIDKAVLVYFKEKRMYKILLLNSRVRKTGTNTAFYFILAVNENE